MFYNIFRPKLDYFVLLLFKYDELVTILELESNRQSFEGEIHLCTPQTA